MSISANIAEGAEREGTREFLQFLGIAGGALAETETLLIMAQRLELTMDADVSPILEQASTVGRMLNGLKRSLRKTVISDQ